MSRKVSFTITEPSEGEYFEEYNKINKLTSWFILILILTGVINFCQSVQTGIYNYSSVEHLFFHLLPEITNATSEWSKPGCEVLETMHLYRKNNTNNGSCQREVLSFELRICQDIGISVGSAVTGILGDVFGRRKIILISSISWMMMSYMMIFVKTRKILFYVCLLISAFCHITQSTAFITFGEIANRKTRALCLYTFFGSSLGGFAVSYVSSRIHEWKKLTVFIASTTPLVLFACWYIPQSPRWLMNVNKKQEAFLQLQDLTGLKYNFGVNQMDVSENVEHGVDREKGKILLVWHLLKYTVTKKLKNLLIFGMLTVVSTLFYASGKWKTVVHFIYTQQLETLSVTIEATSYLFITPVYIFLGKRFGLFAIYVLLSVGSLVALLADTTSKGLYYSVFKIFLGLSAVHLLWAYALEVFPTFMRSTVFGFLGIVSGLTSICSVILMDRLENMDRFNFTLALLLVSTLGLTVLILPVTSKQDLPNYKLYSQ